MALAECHECGEEVSTKADQCPHCGVSHPTREWASKLDQVGETMQGCGCLLTLLVTVPIVILFGMAVCAGS